MSGYHVRVLADSLNSSTGDRLTTLEVRFPRCVLAEFNTHRMFSRNAASSRAIPAKKMIDAVLADPYIPDRFGKAQKGMAETAYLEGDPADAATSAWELALHRAVDCADRLLALGVHKKYANRLLEPFAWTTVIVTGTTAAYANFFHLRCSPLADPALERAATLMRDAYMTHTPDPLYPGDWHLPLVAHDELTRPILDLRKMSVGRCARVSYLTHDGRRDPDADIALHDRLAADGHWSPFEHQARANARGGPPKTRGGNFGPAWTQYRKTFAADTVTLIKEAPPA